MSPAPLRPTLVLALLVAVAAAAAAQQLPARARPTLGTHAKAEVADGGPGRPPRQAYDSEDGSGSVRFVRLVTGPTLRLLSTQLWASSAVLRQLAALVGAGSVAPLYEAAVAASGSMADPTAFGPATSGEDVADLVL
ncbi:hypothetical protein MSG28_012023 [Choristoneura fumiferana]|uniref:Uncharacterized protein n=1 Tax=Choristoneura fumiferana TaxID=7141 RepID=A0ACC0KMN5_CHOFU|nr:hypothetical protein MSG28_012023 [Choristoneura fumiferana]